MQNHFWKIGIFFVILSVLITGWSHLNKRKAHKEKEIQQKITAPSGEVGGAGRLVLGKKIPLNQASVKDLTPLPGIGPDRAEKIVEWRKKKGLFKSIEELEKVPGIGPQTVAGVKDYLTLEDSSQ